MTTKREDAIAWLREHSYFTCDYCLVADEVTLHNARDLKMLDDTVICNDCWCENRHTAPKEWAWDNLLQFDPFKELASDETKSRTGTKRDA